MPAGTADGVRRAGEPRWRAEDFEQQAKTVRAVHLARARGRYDSTSRMGGNHIGFPPFAVDWLAPQ